MGSPFPPQAHAAPGSWFWDFIRGHRIDRVLVNPFIHDDDESAVRGMTEHTGLARGTADALAFDVGQHMLDILDRQSVLFDVLGLATRVIIPAVLLQHGRYSQP